MLAEATILLRSVTKIDCHKLCQNISNGLKVKGRVQVTFKLFTFLIRHFHNGGKQIF